MRLPSTSDWGRSEDERRSSGRYYDAHIHGEHYDKDAPELESSDFFLTVLQYGLWISVALIVTLLGFLAYIL